MPHPSRGRLTRLAGPITRTPLLVAGVAALVLVIASFGLLRWSVSTGQDLLVGSRSSAGQAYQRFSDTFGGDPIVVAFSSPNARTYADDVNLLRFNTLEDDLAHDPRVVSVVGPGTIAISMQRSVEAGLTKVQNEYPLYIAELNAAYSFQKAPTPTAAAYHAKVSEGMQASSLLALEQLIGAADAAQTAREQYVTAHTAAGISPLDEVTAGEAAAGQVWDSDRNVQLLFSAYWQKITGQAPDAAKRIFVRFVADYGPCNAQVATILQQGKNPDGTAKHIASQIGCQVFEWRTLLDLHACTGTNGAQQCPPMQAWGAVLPAPRGGQAVATITVRLRSTTSSADAAAVAAKIGALLQSGTSAVGDDAYLKSLSPAQRSGRTALGPLAPTVCGGAAIKSATGASTCGAFTDSALGWTTAGAPLLAAGLTDTVSHQLILLIPGAILLMLVVLVVAFRARGRLVPLVSAVLATAATTGLCLIVGISITPAVLAGVPVLVGLAVDYAVQLVARYERERRQTDAASAVRTVLATTGPATGVAALSTLGGLLIVALLTGVDAGPLTAIPLVAVFAVVLSGGIVLAWLSAIVIALPLAVWVNTAFVRPADDAGRDRSEPVPMRGARSWLLAPAVVLSLIGWLALPHLPVQTDIAKLVAPSLPALQDVQQVRAATGYAAELDIFLEGGVVGTPDAGTQTPTELIWQAETAADIRKHDGVAQATSIGDVLLANAATTSAPVCPSPTPGPSPTVRATASSSAAPTASAVPAACASPTPAAAPSATGTPRAVGAAQRDFEQLAARVPFAVAASPTAAAASVAASPTPAAASSPAVPSPATTTAPKQSSVDCSLRFLPALARVLVMDIAPSVVPCGPVDPSNGTPLLDQNGNPSAETPINPTSARIAVGSSSTSVADQAALVTILDNEASTAPPGVTATTTGLAVLAARAYTTISSRALLLNVVPLLGILVLLMLVLRSRRRALLAVLPTALAAGWASIVVWLLGKAPGGDVLGSLSPLSVVLGAVVIALGTEFGVVMLARFDEEMARGAEPGIAAALARSTVGGPVLVSAATLAGGFAVLAVSGLFGGVPLIASFGLAVLIDLVLAVAAVFWIMLPLAVTLASRGTPLAVALPATQPAPFQPASGTEAWSSARDGDADLPSVGAAEEEQAEVAGRPVSTLREGADAPPESAAGASPSRPPRRGVSGRRTTVTKPADAPAPQQPRRHLGVTPHRRSGTAPGVTPPAPSDTLRSQPPGAPADDVTPPGPDRPKSRRRRPPPGMRRRDRDE